MWRDLRGIQGGLKYFSPFPISSVSNLSNIGASNNSGNHKQLFARGPSPSQVQKRLDIGFWVRNRRPFNQLSRTLVALTTVSAKSDRSRWGLILVSDLQVIEVIERIESGATSPFRCRLEDDRLYAVKGKGALFTGLISEVVCARLGRDLGLPIPDFAIAHVERALISAAKDPQLERAIGEGLAFASLWHEPTVPINRSRLIELDQTLLARIYAFDHWVQNGDRSLTELGGNPNMLIDLRDSSLIMIDHNLALFTGYQADELQVHACREAWLDEGQNLVFKQECKAEFIGAIGKVPEIIRSLPDEWLDAEPEAEEKILQVLSRSIDDQFWDEL